MRPRVRESLVVMLERYCAEHRCCRGGPSPATAVRKYDGISEFVARPRGRTWPSFKPNVLPVSINRRV